MVSLFPRVRETLLTLKGLDVVAYGVHDCVMVKKQDETLAVNTYRQVIRIS